MPLPIDEVYPGLWLGPCPSTPEFIRKLHVNYGVKRLVSVQTDADLTQLSLGWETLWMGLMSNAISPKRVPIVDFDDDALRVGLDSAVAAVDSAMSLPRVTYLHCTAGVNRSPSVAIGWLMAHKGLSLDEAWKQVTTRRESQPNRRALERWWQGRAGD
ncbi:MAG TPA: hypothetical protein DCQ06_09660 [Myxococcales bacterium]|nr:hypothetical protein [Myxococcales bacterium]